MRKKKPNDPRRIQVIVRIRWHKSAEGEREPWQKGPVYAANVRFGDDEQLWSIVLLLDSEPDEEGYQVTRAGFLFPEKVVKYLTVGQRITITEATRVVAQGEILERLADLDIFSQI